MSAAALIANGIRSTEAFALAQHSSVDAAAICYAVMMFCFWWIFSLYIIWFYFPYNKED